MRRLLAAVVACALLLPAAARADGDPASDVLILARTFEPYAVKIPSDSRKRLAGTIAQAKANGYSVRVAMIGDAYDLGSAGLLMDHPQDYAKFLAQELAQFNTDWVLVVMPSGYGIYRCVGIRRPEGYVDPCEKAAPMAADTKALSALATPKGDLAASADTAVRALAQVHGVHFGGTPWPLIGGAVAVVVALGAGGLFALRRRRAKV